MRAFEGYNRLVLGSIVVLVGRVAWCRWCVPSGYAVTVLRDQSSGCMVCVAGISIFDRHPLVAYTELRSLP